MNYRKKVLEHFGAKLHDDVDSTVDYSYETCWTNDSYEVYIRLKNGKYEHIAIEEDVYYYAESLSSVIWEDIMAGMTIYVDSEILDILDMENPKSSTWRDEWEQIEING